ncbi:MAG: hypothetical protein ACLR7U_08050 [Ruthenibacterium lactatiformans]
MKKFIFPRREVLFGAPGRRKAAAHGAFQGKARLCGSFGRRHGRRPQALDAGTMPAAMDKYLALRYESRRRSLNISTRPSCSSTSQAPCARPPKAWNSASERRSRACWKKCAGPGLDRFYEDTAYLLHETEKRHAVCV